MVRPQEREGPKGDKGQVVGGVDGTLAGNRASWIGDGTIRLDRADTYQLPLMVVLFNKIDPQDEQGVFSSTEVDFRVRSQQVVLDRIDLRGDAVSLFGTGWMSFDEEINLNFSWLSFWTFFRLMPLPCLFSASAISSTTSKIKLLTY